MDWKSTKDYPPKIGDLGYMKHSDTKIPVAVVRHMLKENTLCFMRRFAGVSNDLSWQRIEDNMDIEWKFIKNTSDAFDCMNWIFSGIETCKAALQDEEFCYECHNLKFACTCI
jgi:hypothetical protein